ncbi:glycerophosphodiester phosphodiesterase family protein [Paenibacillus sp. WQ 127069]|uniref:Glycerophosphodiester phosphodiesterase family protein n=1 Tax=Paenibacillus baimaensis TaxID=2982185 RepID=A0ABT2UDR5_9BACL|nr:glycerophosphodiester phosphodiesterase family protein [Paenibacillus sp. WQ 127069]MCU6792779.1 glycerophosphodiester phosphodiesterase family protein [Paenibacillus sp. WQ 127069]
MMVTDRKGAYQTVHWQAHQSTNAEMPENTLAAMRYAWELGGIPELDIRQTADGVIIGMHDTTPKRTTNAPESDQDRLISECTFAEVQEWDAGIKFSELYRGEKVPALAQILSVLAQYPERELYLDYKEIDLEKMALLIKEYGVGRQIIFCHSNHENCKTVKRLVPEVRTMQWIPDKEVDDRFQETLETGFDSLDIVQIHLVDAKANEGWRYRLQREFLQEALKHLDEDGLELEVLPFHFDQDSMFELLDMGIRRFAVDEPKVFVETIHRYFNDKQNG